MICDGSASGTSATDPDNVNSNRVRCCADAHDLEGTVHRLEIEIIGDLEGGLIIDASSP